MALKWLLASVLLNLVMLLVASLWRAKAWTPAGMMFAVSARDAPPPPSLYGDRCDRAAKNMSENLPFFIAAVLTAYAAGKAGPAIDTGALVFLVARVLYWPIYLSGVPFLRTAIWGVAVGAIAWIGYAAL